jgi:hypothetical protein
MSGPCDATSQCHGTLLTSFDNNQLPQRFVENKKTINPRLEHQYSPPDLIIINSQLDFDFHQKK